MIRRRGLLAAAAATAAAPALLRTAAAQGSFSGFIEGVRAEALRAGISPAILDAALTGLQPNAHVLQLFNHQPEFTLTWAQYRAKVLTPAKLANGRTAYAGNLPLLGRVEQRYGVTPSILVGIWGIESAYGAITGNYGVVDALATLAWDGRRTRFFRSELITALRILQDGDVTPRRMTGSYAGAMGQPQFMPDSYMRYAVDFDGDGRRDIWDSRADVLASIANYLARNGWVSGAPWGQPVRVPPGLDPALVGRDDARPLGEWMRLGVMRIDGTPFSRSDVMGALVMPDPGGEAFMTYANFRVIRRYNPSDYYALAVGLLGDNVV
ncbi:MAG TPA: lytic murein transglycosylase [Acetobacteraceae bacterium]|nr:lytic murein transglycosylase [Acetobacteraceae bacterium]